MGLIFTANLKKRPAYLVLIAAMFTMQNVAEKGVPPFSERLKGVVTKNFLELRPRPPHFSSAAYASYEGTPL